MIDSFIHHEVISARCASDGGGSGHFDVIEEDGMFRVFDGGAGMYLADQFDTLDEAREAAEREARDYEQACREEIDRKFFHGARPTFYDCGICGSYHPNGFHGDCRQDDARFADPDDFYGPEGWDEIAMEDAD